MGQKIGRNISSLSHVIIKKLETYDKDDKEVIFSDCHTYLWRYMCQLEKHLVLDTVTVAMCLSLFFSVCTSHKEME